MLSASPQCPSAHAAAKLRFNGQLKSGTASQSMAVGMQHDAELRHAKLETRPRYWRVHELYHGAHHTSPAVPVHVECLQVFLKPLNRESVPCGLHCRFHQLI